MEQKKIVFLSFFVFLMSCSQPAPKPEPLSPVQTQLLNRLQKMLLTNKRDSAIRSLEKLVQTEPRGPTAAEALLILGNHWSSRKDCQAALPSYERVITRWPKSNYEFEARLQAGPCLVTQKRTSEAILSLQHITKEDPNTNRQVSAHKQLVNLYLQSGARVEALKSTVFISQNAVQPNEKEAFKLRVFDLVDSKLSDAEVEFVVANFSSELVRGAAYFRLGSGQFEQGHYDEARRLLSLSRQYIKEGQINERSSELIEQIDSRRTVDPSVVGAVLPLTGKNAQIGYKTLHGLQLGLGIFGPQKSRLRLSVVDSESNPDVARRAYKTMVLRDHPIAVVGSLLSKTAVAVASKGQEFGVPTIGLSQKSGITEIGDFVFRNSLTSEMQVEQLTQIAMGQKKMGRFAILYPNDAYGVEFANLFWDAVLARGGHIAAAQSYDPKETDFRGPVKRLIGTYFVEAREQEYNMVLRAWKLKQKGLSVRRELPKDLLPPVVDFDAIFIPDNTKAVGQIAAMLAYNDVARITLLGTNLWNDESLIERGGKHVEGSIFVDASVVNPNSDAFFLNSFTKTFSYTPDTFEFQSYDIGMVLRMLLESGVSTRPQLRERLEKLSGFRGSTGTLSMSPRREIFRPLSVLTVSKGQIQVFTN